MQLISENLEGYKFSTSNGATWTRRHLRPMNICLRIKGLNGDRALFHMPEEDKKLFPLATHYVAAGGDRAQRDPLFVAYPAWIKKGTNHQLMIQCDDDAPPVQATIIKTLDWND
jgi:hypothetical protein